ncbi:MAG TPA: SRPBCC family protein [Pyrinomonadaceae bacterium]|nr:SRPBCC family protein [Pyrinomonadaceae bacterium]
MTSSTELEISTPTDREVVLKRTFDAPRELVFEALTTPELLKRWYGPTGWTLILCEIDLKVGGNWHFVVQRPDGKKIGQKGVYHEVISPERIVNTESWEDWNPGETLVTTTLVEVERKTTLTSTSLFPSKEVRDIILKSGLADGAKQSYERLADLLRSVRERGNVG